MPSLAVLAVGTGTNVDPCMTRPDQAAGRLGALAAKGRARPKSVKS